jgi:tRNA dimethylallyltransferase
MTAAETEADARAHRKVIAVVGPTASGKSDLAVEIALRLGGEVVNADSMQLYEGMDIGTAKMTMAERRGVVHHLFDIWPLTKSAAVAEYQTRARVVIDALHARGVLPVVVGGSGLYLRGALDHLDFPGESPGVRAALMAELDIVGAADLHARLAIVDPVAAQGILPSNARRIVRALEVIEITGGPFIAKMPGFDSIYDTTFLGVERHDLYERVELRVHRMMAAGLLHEIRSLLPAGLRTSPTAGKALGYAQLLDVLDDDGQVVGDLDEAVAVTIRATRRFVRRQRSWFRRDPRIHWLDGADAEFLPTAFGLMSVAS